MSGEVSLKAADSDEWLEAEQDTPLEVGDMLRTGPDGLARLSYDDEGLIEIGTSSVLKIGPLEYANTSVSLDSGSLLGRLKNIVSRMRRFSINTDAAVCAVRGTEFGVEYDGQSGETVAGVFDEGEITIGRAGEAGAEPVEVTAGQEVLLRGSGAVKARAMKRLSARRQALGTMLARRKAIEARWKPATAVRRTEMRRQALARAAQRKQKVAAPGKQQRTKELIKTKAGRKAMQQRSAGKSKRPNFGRKPPVKK